MRKYAVVDVGRCVPSLCREYGGACLAIAACPRHLLEQDGTDEPPMLISAVACTGCGKCAACCPARAIEITRGM